MPSEKTARAAERKRIRNRRIITATRTMVGKGVSALQKGEPQDMEPAVLGAVRALDKAVTKGIIHRNNAARRKSRLMAKLNARRTS